MVQRKTNWSQMMIFDVRNNGLKIWIKHDIKIENKMIFYMFS